MVLILDDLHWADTSTTLLLGHLLQDAAPMRLLVLGTARASTTRASVLDAAAPPAGVRAHRRSAG